MPGKVNWLEYDVNEMVEADKLMGDVAEEGALVGRKASNLPGLNTILNFAPALIATREQMDQLVLAVKKGIERNI